MWKTLWIFQRQVVILASVGGGLGGGLGARVWVNSGWEGIVYLAIGISFVILLGMWLFLKLEPIESEEDGPA